MSIWKLPIAIKQAKELKKLFAKPLLANQANDRLTDIFDDDDMFDEIVNIEKHNADLDVRFVVKLFLRNILIYNPQTISKDWDQEALTICHEIIR